MTGSSFYSSSTSQMLNHMLNVLNQIHLWWLKKKPTRHFKHIDFTFLCITNRAQSLSTLFQPRWSKCWLLSDAGSELVQPVNILGTELFVNPREWKPLHMIPISQHCQDQLWRTTSTLHKCFQTTFSSGNTYNALFTLTKLALFFF